MSNSDYISQEDHQVLSDYALLDVALSLGGRYSQRLELAQSPASEEPALYARGSEVGSPLSKAHIRPHVEYMAGASLLKAHRGGVSAPLAGGGRRGNIKGFSAQARRRLMYFIAGVRRDAALPLFITLTYPESFPDPKGAKRHIKMFFQRLDREHPEHGTIHKLEPQERGAPHFHLMTWGCDLLELMRFVPQAWYEIAGGGDYKHFMWHSGELGNGNQHCVQQVRKFEGVRNYASKYLGKTFEVAGWSEQWTGRFWGVVNRSNIPLGELVQVEVEEKKAVELLRYERRFSGLNKFRTNKSLTIFCDADQWIEKVVK